MRMEPLTPPYDDDTRRWLAKWMIPGMDVEPLALFRLLAIHRELSDRCRPMASGLLNKGLLPPRDREIIIARTTARAGAEYEWGVHATVFGPIVGLDQPLLDALATKPASSFEGHIRLLATAVDNVYDDATLSDRTWHGLRQVYDDPQILELLLLTGWYRTLSTVITSTHLPLEPWAARFPTP